MIQILNFLTNSINKKSKKKILNKLFEIIKIIMLSHSIFDFENNNKLKIKQIEILYKLIEIVFIQNNGKIKLEKKMFELIDKYNNINDLFNKKEKFEKLYSNLEDNCNLELENDSSVNIANIDLENDD